MLSKKGKWKLVTNTIESNNKVRLLKAIRNILYLPMSEIIVLKKTFPNLIWGTKAEMEWLQQRLLTREIKSFVRKKDRDDNLRSIADYALRS